MLRSTWDEVCARVRSSEDPFFHDPWLDRLTFVDADEERVVLATPNRLYVEWIQENLEPLLMAHVEAMTGQRYFIEYELDASVGPGHGDLRTASGAADVAAPIAPAYESHLNVRHTFESFVVGSGNQFATAACQNVGDSPARNYNPLFIFGGVGLGKTHLLHAIGNRVRQRDPSARVLYLSANDFTTELINCIRFKRMEEFREKFRRNCDVLLMDDIEFLGGKERTQEEFFHTFEALHTSGKQIAITADRYPKDIEGLEERLRSRFDWGLVADIQPPDTETKVAILRRKADEESMELPNDVAFFIARHVNGNVRELEGTLTRLLAMSSFHAAQITVEFARKSLNGYLRVEERHTTVDTIQSGVARFFGVKVQDLKGPRRTKQVVVPRQIAMYLAREHTSLSLPEIGKRFGNRDHTTVLHAVRRVKATRGTDANFRSSLDGVTRSLGLPLE
jgi:chromosomal replication initiator protein